MRWNGGRGSKIMSRGMFGNEGSKAMEGFEVSIKELALDMVVTLGASG